MRSSQFAEERDERCCRIGAALLAHPGSVPLTAGVIASQAGLTTPGHGPDMDNLSSHTSAPVREWLAAHPRITQVPIPAGACWLNLQEGWWRLFRRAACAGQSFADAAEIDLARAIATGATS